MRFAVFSISYDPETSLTRKQIPQTVPAYCTHQGGDCGCPTMSYIMTGLMRVIATHGYDRRAARLLTAGDRAAAEAAIAGRPEGWPVIPGTGGARKARVALPGRGKRGGARVIYFFSSGRNTLAFLDIYAKAAKEDLSSADKEDLRNAIAEILATLETDGAG